MLSYSLGKAVPPSADRTQTQPFDKSDFGLPGSKLNTSPVRLNIQLDARKTETVQTNLDDWCGVATRNHRPMQFNIRPIPVVL